MGSGVWRTGLVIVVGLVAVYPVAGTHARTASFDASPTLDGERWLERSAPDDAAAIAGCSSTPSAPSSSSRPSAA